jgi:hypothetical protein
MRRDQPVESVLAKLVPRVQNTDSQPIGGTDAPFRLERQRGLAFKVRGNSALWSLCLFRWQRAEVN